MKSEQPTARIYESGTDAPRGGHDASLEIIDEPRDDHRNAPCRSCRCNCGYTCNRRCGLPMQQCIAEHYVKDCEHVFEGWVEHVMPEGGAYGTTVCSHCGLEAIHHDMMAGP